MNISSFFKTFYSPDKDLFRAIKNLFGYYPSNIHLFRLAFCHKAVASRLIGQLELNNERLEYLGDAVLSSVVADYLYKKYPLKDEGFLTEMRSRIVSRSNLNKLAWNMGFEKLIFKESGPRTKSKSVYGDTFEAVIGAIYIDKGYNFTRKIVIKRVIKIYLDIDEIINTETNFKSRLIEWAQKEKKDIEYQVVDEVGKDHNKQYIVNVMIDGKTVATSRDFSIKGAEKLVSEKAWLKMFGEDEESN